MGVFIKKNHGVEYVYVLVGKTHYFIGRKNDPGSVNIDNLHKALDALSANFNRSLAKYIEDLKTCISYLPKNNKSEYLKQQRSDLNDILNQLINTDHTKNTREK